MNTISTWYICFPHPVQHLKCYSVLNAKGYNKAFVIVQQGSQFCPTVIAAWEAMLKEEALIDAVRAKNTDAGQVEAVSI